ncbi:vitamin K epoxide reductase family protein [Candidatus Saccharibacteria bacterium]|nr:vitamin K epoxide reductase family protein [Candidatus Saccharibacteria bacterium]
MAKKVASTKQAKLSKYFPWLLVGGGSLGLVAAFVLTLEKIALLKNPEHVLSCDINPIVACGSVINTWQASAFGFPNPLIGIFGFGAVIVVGVSLLAGMDIKKVWYWRTFWAGTVFGAGFIHWLAFQSIYRIGALCPYCMVVWSVTVPIFWYTTLWLLRAGYLKLPSGYGKIQDFMQRNHFGLLLAWYLIVFFAIMNRFWYFFGF